MKTLQRAGLATIVALAFSLAATAAFAVEYEDIIGLTREGVSTRTIMELIAKDGRAFEMSEEETQRLVDAGVDADVIKAMLDPSYAQTWLDGGNPPSGGGASGGYSTSLDDAYGQGYSAGVATSLVFSFGYYYGPLSRYYYCDPFYYSFWNSGFYGYGYWPSYYAAYYRPYAPYYCAYPYNYYNYGSYYCHTYYDPGYYAANGYNVSPYGRSVYDNSPRWRDGGMSPETGGRVRDGMIADGRNPASPPVVRDLQQRGAGGTRTRDLVANNGMRNGRASREVGSAGGTGRSGGGGASVIRPSDRTATRIDRSQGDLKRGNEAGRMAREGRTPRTVGSGEVKSGQVGRSSRTWLPKSGEGSSSLRRADGSADRVARGSSRGVTRYDQPGNGRQMSTQRGRSGSSYNAPRGTQRSSTQALRSSPSSRGGVYRSNGGGSAYRSGGSAARGGASMSRGGGGSAPRGGGATMSRGGGGGGGARGGGGGGGGARGGGGGGARGGGGGGGRGR